MKLAHDSAYIRPKSYKSLINAPKILPVHRFLLVLAGRKQTVVRDRISPRKPPGSRLGFSRTRDHHSSSLSTMGQLSTLAKFGAYSSLLLPNRTGNGTLACAAAPYQALPDSVAPAYSRLPPYPEGYQIGAREEAHRVDTITSSTKQTTAASQQNG